MLRIFIYRKIQRLRPGLNARTREPEASMRTTRPPKPSSFYLRLVLRDESLIVGPYHPDVHIFVGKDVSICGYFWKPEGVREHKSLGSASLAVSLPPVIAVLGLNQGQFGWELQWSKCYWGRFFSSTWCTSISTISPILRTPIHSCMHSFINDAVFVCYQSTALLKNGKSRWKSVVILKLLHRDRRLDGPQIHSTSGVNKL
jgi:hypothetical protein